MSRSVVLLYAALLGACQSKPLDIATPEPIADSLVVAMDVHNATLAAVRAVTDEGLPIRLFEPKAGLVETEYFDLTARLTQYDNIPVAERTIRLRFIVRGHDGSNEKSVIRVQVLQAAYFPRNFRRRDERAVGRHHPGTELAHLIVSRLGALTEKTD